MTQLDQSPQSTATASPADGAGVCLVTGTSSGIGLATAVAAARAGWTVIATMRDTTRNAALAEAAATAGVDLDLRTLDVTDAAQAAACVSSVVEDHGSLDALVNNAGAAYVGTLETDDVAAIRACMEVNFFGVLTTTRAALPHLRASRGRVLTVSSVGGVVGQPFNETYCAAKFAIEGFLQALAPVAATVGVQVGVVEPGAVASEFVTNLGLDVPALLARSGPYAPAMQAYLERTMSAFDPANAQTPDEVAKVILDALMADPMPFRTQTSSSAAAFVSASISDLDGSAVQQLTRGWVSSL